MPDATANLDKVQTTACVAGGGPAGMVLGFLLARSGVDVEVLEKHADFVRDFRGDTIHPSTFELMYELGILADFLRVPHQELTSIAGVIEGTTVTIADFSHLPTHCKFAGIMPQWDFLNFMVQKGRAYPQFHLRMESEVTDLIVENNRVVGVRCENQNWSARNPRGSRCRGRRPPFDSSQASRLRSDRPWRSHRRSLDAHPAKRQRS